MGGHGDKYPPVLIDPAIEKWYHMKESTHAYFKFDRRTIKITLALTVLFPAVLYVGSVWNMGNFKPRGVRRGESFWSKPVSE
ncbi:uncharacterized protein BJ171DRAFT_502976 [Polychytrium aggregatum]|uniref:uncharacterized protein n=1 Tax=Polychytrium aggregatum TaxID=110093 RepID=UPI0022FE054D|nr:uncharacterized protein BJ171DRAFT_502976 [Polychytrium aggregatum]KAI9205089.1 hypothetical protein BJ171DRAFT_502976 [Polychytrium aggregatum]